MRGGGSELYGQTGLFSPFIAVAPPAGTPAYDDAFVARTISLLQNDALRIHEATKGLEWARTQTWDALAEEWSNALKRGETP